MREFLSDPIFWIREAVRWHWWEIVKTIGVTWFFLSLVLLLVTHAFE